MTSSMSGSWMERSATSYDAADLSIQEPDIEDVIRELYAGV